MDGHTIFCDRAGPENKLSHLQGPMLFSPHYTKQDVFHIQTFSRSGMAPLPPVQYALQLSIQTSEH